MISNEVFFVSKAKILVVDDESRMRKLVRDFLNRADFDVMEAENGEQAVDIFYANKDIALILLDVMMPKMNWKVSPVALPLVKLTIQSFRPV